MRIDRDKLREPVRFAITGVIATAVQYAIYWLLMDSVGVSVAWTVGFIISLVANFMLTTYFTFNVKPDRKKAGGFVLSHIINWAMQLVMLNLLIRVGVPKAMAPFPMYVVCIPMNFLLVRFFVKKAD